MSCHSKVAYNLYLNDGLSPNKSTNTIIPNVIKKRKRETTRSYIQQCHCKKEWSLLISIFYHFYHGCLFFFLAKK